MSFEEVCGLLLQRVTMQIKQQENICLRIPITRLQCIHHTYQYLRHSKPGRVRRFTSSDHWFDNQKFDNVTELQGPGYSSRKEHQLYIQMTTTIMRVVQLKLYSQIWSCTPFSISCYCERPGSLWWCPNRHKAQLNTHIREVSLFSTAGRIPIHIYVHVFTWPPWSLFPEPV